VTIDSLSKVEEEWLSKDKEAEELYTKWLSLLAEGDIVALSDHSGNRRVTAVSGVSEVNEGTIYLGEAKYFLESGRVVKSTCVWRKAYPATEQEKTDYMLTLESERLVMYLEDIVANASPQMAPFTLLVVREMQEALNKLDPEQVREC